MSKNELEKQITKCLAKIEKKLAWGKSEDWTHYDFSKLSDEIHGRTQVQLSVTTLKRIWGRLKYDSAPTLTTLNALAVFAGYADWRDFSSKHLNEGNVTETAPAIKVKQPVGRVKKFWILGAIPLIVVAYFLIFSVKKPALNPDDFTFSLNKMVTEGVPNSVVFNYDASAAPTDSIFIVQTWDITRKKLVSRNNHEHSAIYYYPGFFNTKLIVDNQIVKAQDLWITSNGWLGLMEDEPVPLYFRKEEYSKADGVEIDEALLKKYNLSLYPTPPRIRIFNQQNLGNLMNDNFIFETQIKSDFQDGTAACQTVEVLIQCKDDIIFIPLGSKNCVGNFRFWFCGTGADATDADLSGFGSNLSEWTKLRIETVNKTASIFVNDTKAYTLTFPNEPTGIVGVQYRFNGVGAVKDTWFENHSGRIQF